jgi:hypothetical protein
VTYVYRRGLDDDAQDDHEDLWHELAERVCRVPGWEQRPGDPHRAFHQDIPSLCDVELALERQRAVFRACLERNRLARDWLLRRIDHLDEEAARRAAAGACRPPSPPPSLAWPWTREPAARPAARRTIDPRLREEAECGREEWQHQQWLRHQEAVAAHGAPGAGDEGGQGMPGGPAPMRLHGGTGGAGQERAR